MTTMQRRTFLLGAGGLTLGLFLPRFAPQARARSGVAGVIRPDEAVNAAFEPNAFIRIGEDDLVTVLVKHIEFGQGPYTGLATLVAEELDADWSQMRATAAPADATIYANTLFGLQGTGGSTAIANSWMQMRKAGAAARAMLVSAAAEAWNVRADEITVSKGQVRHEGSGRSSGFGALAAAAATVNVPVDPPLKGRENWTLIGTDRPKLDSPAKTTGAADFTLDVFRPNMQVVTVLHPPVFGATVENVDDAAARAVPGVRAVRQVPQGVAVYADNTFAALKGRNALSVTWNEAEGETRSSDDMYAQWNEAARTTTTVAEEAADVAAALDGAASVHEAEYFFPFLAHAPMEPLDGVIELSDGAAEVWMGSQLQTVDHGVLAGALELPQDRITLNTMLAGGSFGRRAQPGSPFAAELAAVAKAAQNDGDGPNAGETRAFKLMWDRRDDITNGHYRPLTVHRLRAGLDADGNIVAWDNAIANQSIVAGSAFEALMTDGLDPTSYEGSTKMPYKWPASQVRWAQMESKVPILWWRSVGHTHTAYATETFLDELLEKGGKDAVEGRLALIENSPRDAAVLARVAEIANWRGPKGGVAEGRARGVALHESFNSYVAMIAEVSEQNGLPRVHKVWCAIDCGVAVNPNIIRAQVEGGVGFGLGAAMFDEITLLPGGRVAQSNFDDYRAIRINEMPEVEVAIIESDADPTGVGEPGVPPVAPAVANAWRALTGETPRRLPIHPVGGSV